MKRISLSCLAAAGIALALGACASGRELETNQKLALYRANAGEPVSAFRYLGRMDRWESLGDRALAVWTRPREAWLLELGAPCPGLNFAIAIGLTSHTGQVSARFDDVLVPDATPNVPCRIQTIRPLDVDALRAAGQDRRAADQPSGT
ncbi:MAG TPA: DUF6491 family protein [Xanthomonadaceae bacterium]|nr:DUF6491 family protein [Xanthomonadaceae bacterium]